MKNKGTIEYKMPAGIAKKLLADRKGNDLKMSTNEYLCKVVNDEYRLLRKCVKVIIY